MKLPVSLRLRGRDGVNVPDIAALDAGISRYVGKPSEDVVATSSLALSHYRKCVLLGELVPADKSTADALGVAFDVPKSPKPKD